LTTEGASPGSQLGGGLLHITPLGLQTGKPPPPPEVVPVLVVPVLLVDPPVPGGASTTTLPPQAATTLSAARAANAMREVTMPSLWHARRPRRNAGEDLRSDIHPPLPGPRLRRAGPASERQQLGHSQFTIGPPGGACTQALNGAAQKYGATHAQESDEQGNMGIAQRYSAPPSPT
jgi:hypothetical protein